MREGVGVTGGWAPRGVSTGELPGGGEEAAASRCAACSVPAAALTAALRRERRAECWWLRSGRAGAAGPGGRWCQVAASNPQCPVLLFAVIQSLIALVNDPQPEHPLRADLAEEYSKDRKKFCKNAEEFTKKYGEKRPVD